MISGKYRFLIPNGLTFLSLLCGTCSILMSASTTDTADALWHLWVAGLFILASYGLDMFDGLAARSLHASTDFGLQLDSLTDMVSLGMAPAILLFMYLFRVTEFRPALIVPVVVLVPLAGAFRLARFNLLPPKTTGSTDSTGLTISTGGAILALAVLSEVTGPANMFPDYLYFPLMISISLLMVSTIAFPSLTALFSERRTRMVLIALMSVSLLGVSFFRACFLWGNAYVGFALARAGYRRLRRGKLTEE
jgi:CDP-diacylglycerol---serine O-phosphatidyltransferase